MKRKKTVTLTATDTELEAEYAVAITFGGALEFDAHVAVTDTDADKVLCAMHVPIHVLVQVLLRALASTHEAPVLAAFDVRAPGHEIEDGGTLEIQRLRSDGGDSSSTIWGLCNLMDATFARALVTIEDAAASTLARQMQAAAASVYDS